MIMSMFLVGQQMLGQRFSRFDCRGDHIVTSQLRQQAIPILVVTTRDAGQAPKWHPEPTQLIDNLAEGDGIIYQRRIRLLCQRNSDSFVDFCLSIDFFATFSLGHDFETMGLDTFLVPIMPQFFLSTKSVRTSKLDRRVRRAFWPEGRSQAPVKTRIASECPASLPAPLHHLRAPQNRRRSGNARGGCAGDGIRFW